MLGEWHNSVKEGFSGPKFGGFGEPKWRPQPAGACPTPQLPFLLISAVHDVDRLTAHKTRRCRGVTYPESHITQFTTCTKKIHI